MPHSVKSNNAFVTFSLKYVFLIFIQYLLLLITISALELFVGGITYIYQTRVDDEVIQTLNVTFMNDYGIDDKRTNEIDLMQQTVCVSIILNVAIAFISI